MALSKTRTKFHLTALVHPLGENQDELTLGWAGSSSLLAVLGLCSPERAWLSSRLVIPGAASSRGCGSSPGSLVVGAGVPRDSSVPCASLGRWVYRKGLAESAMRVSAPALGGTGSAATEEWAPAQGWKRLRQALTFLLIPPWTAGELRSAGERRPAGRGMLRAAPSLEAPAGRGGGTGDAVGWFKGIGRSSCVPGLPQGRCLLAQGSSSAGSCWWRGVRSGGSLFHVLAGVS